MIVVVPTLAAISERYAVGPGQGQLLIAAYLFGLGAGQPVAGALSDRFGRRPVMVGGFVLFTLASLACAIAASFPALLIGRLLQALGVSVGTVGSRAIVRDTHDALGTVRALGWIGAAMGIAPVVGPLIGGALTALAGPQSVFLVSAALGLVVTVAMVIRLTETRQGMNPTAETQHWTTSYRQLLGSRVFVGYTLMYAFLQGCFIAFLAVAAIVFADHLGINEARFGIIWGALGLTYVAGATGGARLTTRLGSRRLLLLSTGMILLSGGSLLAATIAWGVTLSGLLLPLALLMFAAGIQTPLSVAGAVNCRQDIAGTAAGLSSSLALVLSGSFSILSGFLYAGDFLPIAALIAGSAGLVAATVWMTRGPD
jgi:DHA1 family bicyclomycin/chloramphenicol resistance-like MFS transporter